MNITPDLETFNPALRREHSNTVLLYVGLVNITDNLKNFLSLPDDLGTKIVVGSGTAETKEKLSEMFPQVAFNGYKDDQELAQFMANADVLVSPPSDLVIMYANACGTPIASLPWGMARTFITDHLNGVIDNDLTMAVVNATTLDREKVREYAEQYYGDH